MPRAFQGLVTAVFLLAYATVTAEAQVNVLAPVLKSNSKGAFKPFKAKGNAEFTVIVRLYEDSAGLTPIENDLMQPWEEELSFSVQGKTLLPASDPASGEYSLYVPVDGFVDLNIGAQTSTPLPADLGSGFVYFTTEVTPYKKGVPQTPYDESPTKLLPRSAPERYMSLVELDDGQGGFATTLRIEGANLQIVNGTGSTAGAVDGLGNLIVGYNEIGNPGGDDRTGSHNIVTGRQNSFPSYGGLVAGQTNTVSGRWSSVSGGRSNTASGYYSSVSGGVFNTASGNYSSVSGGRNNTASGSRSWVSGGRSNTASGDDSSGSGGRYNTASGFASSVSGGFYNTASGGFSSVSGGEDNVAYGDFSSVSGGYKNTASGGFASSVSGGFYNTASGDYSSVSGGALNTASGNVSSVSGGVINEAGGYRSSVSGGYNRSASGEDNWAAGGLSESN